MQNNKLINIIHPSKSHAKLTSPLSQPETRNRETKLREKKLFFFFPPQTGGKVRNKIKENRIKPRKTFDVLHSYKKKRIVGDRFTDRREENSVAAMLRHRRRRRRRRLLASSSSSSSSWVHAGLATDSDVPSRSIRPTRAPPLRRSWADFFPFERGACAGFPFTDHEARRASEWSGGEGRRTTPVPLSLYLYGAGYARPSNRRLSAGVAATNFETLKRFEVPANTTLI